MEAIEIIEYLRERDFTLKADGQYLDLAPVEKITDELIQRLRKYKSAIIAELKREERRKKVLSILAANPDSQRAIVTDTESDRNSVIIAIAIRDQYAFEMQIPKEKYDAFTLLEMINKGLIQ